MNDPEPLPSPPRPAVGHILRGIALAGLAIGLGLVGGLFLITLFRLQPLFGFLADGRMPSLDAGMLIAPALIVFAPLAVGYVALRLRPLTLRRGVVLTLIALTILVGNLILVASVPSVREGFETVLGVAFWKVSGLVVVLTGVTLLTAATAAWRLRPSSLRGLVQFSLALGFILTADLVLVALCPPLLDGFQTLLRPFSTLPDHEGQLWVNLALTAVLVGLTPLIVFIAAWRLRLHSWRWIAGSYVVLTIVLTYLAMDDPVARHAVAIGELSPAFPGAEDSFGVLMRYGKTHPLARNFHPPQRIYDTLQAGQAIDPGKPDQWLAWLTAHRSGIEADWAELVPVRTWWSELNGFDRIGDLTPPRFDAEIIAFAPPRSMCQHGCAIASLQALDGHGDEAIEALLPILQVGRKLQPSARTLVRAMIAIVIERMSLQTANFILDHATVSPAARARLTNALADGVEGGAGARRLMAIDYVFYLNAAQRQPLGSLVTSDQSRWLRLTLNAVSPFVYNSRATFNLYGDFNAELQEIAANRQLERINPRGSVFATQEARPRFKNFGGSLLLGAAIPAMSRVAESYWKTQDTRATLLTRLAKT